MEHLSLPVDKFWPNIYGINDEQCVQSSMADDSLREFQLYFELGDSFTGGPANSIASVDMKFSLMPDVNMFANVESLKISVVAGEEKSNNAILLSAHARNAHAAIYDLIATTYSVIDLLVWQTMEPLDVKVLKVRDAKHGSVIEWDVADLKRNVPARHIAVEGISIHRGLYLALSLFGECCRSTSPYYSFLSSYKILESANSRLFASSRAKVSALGLKEYRLSVVVTEEMVRGVGVAEGNELWGFVGNKFGKYVKDTAEVRNAIAHALLTREAGSGKGYRVNGFSSDYRLMVSNMARLSKVICQMLIRQEVERIKRIRIDEPNWSPSIGRENSE